MTKAVGELRKGWRFVLGAFTGIGGGFGSLYFYTAGIFIKPMATEFGWTRGQASMGAISIIAGSTLALPIAGRLSDRYGEIPVALTSGLALSLAFVMLGSLTTGLVSFLLLVWLLSFFAAGSTPLGYSGIIVRHFNASRGLALGLALMGTAVGAALMPPFLVPFIARNGWRDGYHLLAALAIGLTILASLLLRERGGHAVRVRHAPIPWHQIRRTKAFWSISVIILLSAIAVLGTTTHIVPLLTDRGMGAAAAGAAASGLGMAVIGGRVTAGYLLDRWDAGWVAWILLSLAGLGALLLSADSSALVQSGAVLVGFGVGTEGDLLAYLLSRHFPVRSFGTVYGIVFSVHALGAGLGGFFAGAAFDHFGGYSAWLMVAAALLAAAGIIALVTERGVRPAQPRP